MIKKTYVNWEELTFLVNKLELSITGSESKFEPDLILGVSRGGLIPAVMLSHKLDVPMVPLRWSTRDFLFSDENTIDSVYMEVTKGNNLLILDDICDSGKTFGSLEEHFRELYEAEKERIRWACLHLRHDSSFTPNYHALYVEDDSWIVYPYEAE